MNTDQARRLVTLHDNADRALANLRNANAMAADDPRAPELLEEAGDAYAEATAVLFTEQTLVVGPLLKAIADGSVEVHADAPSASETTPEGFEPGKAAWLTGGLQEADDGNVGAGVIVPPVEGVVEGNVALRLATDAKYRGEDFPKGATISVPTTALTLEQPEGAPSVDLGTINGAREGQAAETA